MNRYRCADGLREAGIQGDTLGDKRLRVFLMEDKPDSYQAIRLMLESLNCEVTGAMTSADALKHLSAERFDAALLDIAMENGTGVVSPDGKSMDGLDMCRWIREVSPQPDVPICIITAVLDHRAAIDAFQIGASGSIVKPFDLQELQAKLNELVGE